MSKSGGWDIRQMPEFQAKEAQGMVFVPRFEPPEYEYQPTYWEDPMNVARAVLAQRVQPPGGAPLPVDERVNAAFDLFRARNNNRPWYEWQPLATDDPSRAFLQSISLPPDDFLTAKDRVKYQTPTPQSSGVGEPKDLTFGIPTEQFAKLPKWQQVVLPLLPWVGRVAGGVQGAVMGAGAAGPIGAVVGGAAGAGAAYAAERSLTLQNVLMKLDLPAEFIERAVGVWAQARASLEDPERYGPLGDLLENLPAAWKAASLAYNVNAPNAWLGKPIEGWGEYWEAPEGQDARFWALTQARGRIARGEDPELVLAEIRNRFGLAGELRDMVGHMLLDPLNILPEVTNKAVVQAGKLTGNAPLVKAFGSTGDTLRGVQKYAQELHNLSPDDLKQYGWLSRTIAGATKEGTLKIYEQPGLDRSSVRRALDALTGLTPQARASNLLDVAQSAVSAAVADLDNADDVLRVIQNVAEGTPGDAVQYWRSAEAQPIPGAMRSGLEKLENIHGAYTNTRQHAQIMRNIAETTGQDVYRLLAELHNGDVKTAEAVLVRFKNALAGDQNGAKLLEALDNPENPMTGAQLKRVADVFVGEDPVPFEISAFKAKAVAVMADAVEDYAVKWFGVKPDPGIYRVSNTFKKAQALVLLGLNPAYLINNSLNNIVTLSWDGLFGSLKRATRLRYLNDMGFTPPRLRHGVGPADIADTSGAKIRAAMRVDDGLDKFNDFLGKGDKIAYFATLSQHVEQWSSEIAMVTGMREFWNKAWRPGVGFDRVPQELRIVLDAVQPGLSSQVDNAIARGKNRAQIEQMVFGDLSKRSLRDVLSKDEAVLLGHFPDVVDDLDGVIQSAKSVDDVRAAFGNARAKIETEINRQVARKVRYLAEKAAAKAKLEGASGALDEFDQVAGMRGDFWIDHFKRMDEIANQAQAYSGAARSAIWAAGRQEASRLWNAFQNIEGAKILGIAKGLGGSDDAALIEKQLLDLHSLWNEYYRVIDDDMANFYATEFSDRSASSAAWQEMTERHNQLYLDNVGAEKSIQDGIDNQFADMFQRQFGEGRDQAYAWRRGIAETRNSMVQAMTYFRTGKGNPPAEIRHVIDEIIKGAPAQSMRPEERHAAWGLFVEKVYNPLISAQVVDSGKTARAMYGVPEKPAVKKPPTVLPQKGTVKNAGEIRRVANEYGIPSASKSGKPMDKAIVNAYNKHKRDDAPAVMNINDIEFADFVEAMEQRKVAGVEPVQPAAPIVELLERKALDDAARAEMESTLAALEDAITAVEESGRKVIEPETPGEDVSSVWKPKETTSTEPKSAISPEPTPAVGAPLGTADGFHDLPLEEAAFEGWMRDVGPALSNAEQSLLSPVGAPVFGKDLPEDVQHALRVHLGKVYGQLTDAKLGASRWGEVRRDAALLNYKRRIGFDNILGFLMPYQFWYTRSMVNWAARSLSRPMILANYGRIMGMGERAEREGYPTRLRGKVGMDMPFAEDWMGPMFADPLRQIFPFVQLAKPFQNLYEQNNLTMRRTESILQRMIEDEEITAEEGQRALDEQSGDVWERAYSRAQIETDQDVRNPLDFAWSLSGPSLPIGILYNIATGRKDRISQLPITRLVQNATAAVGIGGNRGWNIEAPARRLFGLPEVDRFDDYRIDRMLANMTAEGVISADEAQRAMIDREGEAFDLANRRVAKMGLWQYAGAPLAVDFFPEGEQDQRALAKVYSEAIEKKKAGDDKALTAFFDKYPEYEARLASFKKPEDRLKRFLISEVWQRYNEMPELHQREAAEQLGDTFRDAFLNKETRSYNSISTATLANWARMMDANVPKAAPETAQMELKFSDEKTTSEVEEFYAQRNALFPGVTKKYPNDLPSDVFFAITENDPQYRAYTDWKNRYLAEHPNAIPHVTGDKSSLAGLPVEVAQRVYSYRDMKEKRFAGIDALQEAYFNLQDAAERKQFRKENPQLETYWEWRKRFAAEDPRAAPYILSNQTLGNAILGNLAPRFDVQETIAKFSPQLARQFMANMLLGEVFTPGVKTEIERLWREAGKPTKTVEEFIDLLKSGS